MTAPRASEVVSAWGEEHAQGQLGPERAGPRAAAEPRKGRLPHLLPDAAAEVLLDELPAGGRLQLQVPLQSLGTGAAGNLPESLRPQTLTEAPAPSSGMPKHTGGLGP